MSDKILHSAVLVNGGDPLSGVAKLFPRELYIKPNGELVIGDYNIKPIGTEPNASPIGITVAKAREAEYVSLNRSGLYVMLNDREGIINGADISGCYVSPSGALTFGSGRIINNNGNILINLANNGELTGGTLSHNNILRAKLNLSTASYGSKADMNKIANPSPGDIFIVI